MRTVTMKTKVIQSACTLITFIFFFGYAQAQETTRAWVDAPIPPQYFAVIASDVDTSMQWYCTVFGLQKIGGSQADDGTWRIENVRDEHLFVEIIYDQRAQKVGHALGFRKVGFAVPDIDAVADRVEKAIGERPRIVEFKQFNQRILQLRDPDGNTIQLFSKLSDE